MPIVSQAGRKGGLVVIEILYDVWLSDREMRLYINFLYGKNMYATNEFVNMYTNEDDST